jgi:hypothetical protein
MGLQAALMSQICQTVGINAPAVDRSDFEYQLFAEALSSIDFAKAKNCNPSKSHHCIGKTGSGSCVPLTKKCKVPASPAAQQAMAYVEAFDLGDEDLVATPPKPTKPPKKAEEPEIFDSDDLDFWDAELTPIEIAPQKRGKNIPVDAAEEKLVTAAGDFLVTNATQKDAVKIARLEAAGLTQAEAAAIATWIGDGSYKKTGETEKRYALMNKGIYARPIPPPAVQARIDAANELAVKGYEKLPGITPDLVAAGAKKKGEDFDPEAPLQRHVRIDNPQEFIKKYKDAIGKEITEETHFATTHLQNLDWIQSEANVAYRVVPKWDGTGRGRYIDGFKNSASEGEVMFIPGSKFRVKRVLEPEGVLPKPKAPDGFIPSSAIKSIKQSAGVAALKGEDWQDVFKKTHGESAFAELPQSVRNTPAKKLKAELGKAEKVGKKAGAEYGAKLMEWQQSVKQSGYVIELEEA